MSFSDKLKIIEEIVKLPLFSAVGFSMNKLVYITTSEATRSLWVLDTKTGEKVKIADEVIGVSDIVPDSPYLMYTIDVMKGREQHRAYIVDLRKMERYEVEAIEPRRITSIAFDGSVFALSSSTAQVLDLWIVKPDGSAEKVYESQKIFFATSVSGNKIVGQGVLKGDPRAQEIFIFDRSSGEFQVYTPKDGSTNRSPRIHDNKVLFSTTAFGKEKLVILDLEKFAIEDPVFGHDDYRKHEFVEYLNFDWTPDGKIWFIGLKDGRTKVFLDGKLLPVPEGFATNLVYADGKAYVTWSSLVNPYRILEIDLEKNEARTFLGVELPEHIRERIGTVKHIRYKSFDGLEIPAFIVENAKIGKPGPTVIYVHGGPWSSVSDSWNRLLVSIVASGYHVVAPNFRGSTGYGDEFRKMDIGDPGGGDLEDVAHAALWAKQNNLASKIAIMGYSYGGYMTFLATVKKPELWDAGVAGAGITDWAELYELSDALFKRFVEVLFAGKKELLRDRSAITYIENLKAPLCIIHPQNDSRTPLRPVLKYVSKLLELGKTFELHVIPDMGHLINRVEDAVKILFPAIIFLDKVIGST
ncbi:MAG: alpha/beta fold hydrolase [Candidatus Njordarchaeales archaeon]